MLQGEVHNEKSLKKHALYNMNILIGLCANIALDNSDISLSSVSTFFRIAPLLCCPFPTSHNFFNSDNIQDQ